MMHLQMPLYPLSRRGRGDRACPVLDTGVRVNRKSKSCGTGTSPHPYCATNDVTVSEFTLTVYFSPDSNSEPRGMTVSTRG